MSDDNLTMHSSRSPILGAEILACPRCERRNRVVPSRQDATCGACGADLAVPGSRPRAGLAGRLRRLLGERPGSEAMDASRERTRRSSLARFLALASIVQTVGMIGIWVTMTEVGESWWFSTVLLYLPRIAFGLPLLLLIPLAFALNRRFLVLHAGCLLFLLGPLMGWQAPGRGERPGPGARSVKVLTYNVGWGPPAVAALVRAVATAKPDLVLVQETKDLAPLFPGWKTHYAGEYFLATRYAVAETEKRVFLADREWRHGARYRLRAEWGSFDVFSLHLDTPRRAIEELKAREKWRIVQWSNLGHARMALAADAHDRWREAAAARAWTRTAPGPTLIAGDFNGPPDSPLYRTNWRGYRDAFAVAGSGYGYTAHAPRPWIRIDRVLTSPEWRVRRCETLPGCGRDHLPVFAEVWLDN
jgi:endonuclease/exonuclease/phosphatase family metal-dependent hydrolase